MALPPILVFSCFPRIQVDLHCVQQQRPQQQQEQQLEEARHLQCLQGYCGQDGGDTGIDGDNLTWAICCQQWDEPLDADCYDQTEVED